MTPEELAENFNIPPQILELEFSSHDIWCKMLEMYSNIQKPETPSEYIVSVRLYERITGKRIKRAKRTRLFKRIK